MRTPQKMGLKFYSSESKAALDKCTLQNITEYPSIMALAENINSKEDDKGGEKDILQACL